MQGTYKVILSRVRVTIVAVEKQYVLQILSVCVSIVLVIQHAKPMRRICGMDGCTMFFHIII